MNQWQMLEYFCKIAKNYIESLDEEGLNYDLLKFQIDEHGICCSDNELLNIFKNNCNINKNDLYQIIENINLKYCNNFN